MKTLSNLSTLTFASLEPAHDYFADDEWDGTTELRFDVRDTDEKFVLSTAVGATAETFERDTKIIYCAADNEVHELSELPAEFVAELKAAWVYSREVEAECAANAARYEAESEYYGPGPGDDESDWLD